MLYLPFLYTRWTWLSYPSSCKSFVPSPPPLPCLTATPLVPQPLVGRHSRINHRSFLWIIYHPPPPATTDSPSPSRPPKISRGIPGRLPDRRVHRLYLLEIHRPSKTHRTHLDLGPRCQLDRFFQPPNLAALVQRRRRNWRLVGSFGDRRRRRFSDRRCRSFGFVFVLSQWPGLSVPLFIYSPCRSFRRRQLHAPGDIGWMLVWILQTIRMDLFMTSERFHRVSGRRIS